MYPRVLRIETGFSTLRYVRDSWWTDILDYQVYRTIPRWGRRLEEKLHLDVALALQARKLVNQYDIIWADSEKVGICLTGIRNPLVVLTHHLASKKKRKILRLTGIVKKWAGIGYLSDADRDFIVSYYSVSPQRLFRAITPQLTRFLSTSSSSMASDGCIVSLGVSKRDYNTLINALRELPEYWTEIFAGSKFGDVYIDKIRHTLPHWIKFRKPVSSEEVVALYQKARFVIVPLAETTQFSAGMTAAIEASASGKAVIATGILGMSSYIIDGVTGILVPPYDPDALRTAIHKLWTQPDLAYRMGLAGRKYVQVQFDPRVVNAIIKDFLLKIYTESSSNTF